MTQIARTHSVTLLEYSWQVACSSGWGRGHQETQEYGIWGAVAAHLDDRVEDGGTCGVFLWLRLEPIQEGTVAL